MVAFSPEVATAICQRLALGESLRSICRSPGMPDTTTVYKWVREKEDFRALYQEAREFQARLWADEILDVARDTSNDIGPDGRPNNAAVQARRLEVDTLKWLLSHLLPREFGDKQSHEVSGPNGGPVKVEVDKEQIARWLAFQTAKPKENE